MRYCFLVASSIDAPGASNMAEGVEPEKTVVRANLSGAPGFWKTAIPTRAAFRLAVPVPHGSGKTTAPQHTPRRNCRIPLAKELVGADPAARSY